MDDFQDRSHYGFFIHYFATPPASPIPSLSAGFFCRHSKYSPEKWIRRPRNDSFADIRFYQPTVTAESAEIPKFPRISAAAARRRRVKLKIAIFCGLPAAAGGIPALSLEIQKFSGKFKSSAGNSPKPCDACGC